MADEDLALALSLQDEFLRNDGEISTATTSVKRKLEPSSIVDDCWETIDPTPDIRELFLQYNDTYFQGKLSCCEVKWAPRMTLCAGVCCYEGRGGLCSIKLSMPLLKLRPRKDLVQTLLHEMIHAYLFVTNNNKDHNAHGPEFHKHMYRINKQSGANITVYHNFHDEVNIYRQHWWRCDGLCQNRPPYYGMVRRAMNRAPSQHDSWWSDHQRTCGGTYHKVREPEDYGKKKPKTKKEDGKKKINGDSQTKGMPKIYDLWKKTGGGESGISIGETSSSTKGDINQATSSTTGINKLWRVENEDESSSGKENDVQKINNTFKPFTGKGNVLGSKSQSDSSASSSKSRTTFGAPKQRNKITENTPILPSTNQSKAISFDINENDFVQDINLTADESSETVLPTGLQFSNKDAKSINFWSSTGTVSKIERQKKHSGSHITIVDSFKKVGEKKVPVVVIAETPPNTTTKTFVQCPVCLDKVEQNKINTHLDTCL
ncbi:sprT-like domain-containing protein Spartan [Dendronephthya gigantea]|uniref:sprT-like domain-containing protein Spartan n=1 Tax=Dendronephthya gigantea TaxID=151771 RepID=UPI00106917AE|nr:sprT-like domain-containing protein Spartan [Dendronephthya gigantea]